MDLIKDKSGTKCRTFLMILGLALVGPFLSAENRPNVILIIPDQQRYDSLGCNGNPDAITPHIDQLANEGVNFDSAFVSQPLCSPARSSILTGLFPHKTEVWENDTTLTDHTTAFPRILHEHGYKTGYIGKWHLGPKPNPEYRPVDGRPVVPPPDYFDLWQGHDGGASQWIGQPMNKWTVPDNDETGIPDFGDENPGTYRVDFEMDRAIEFVRKYKDEPFCLMVSFRPPHTPWTAPEENCLRFEGRVKYPTYYAMVNRIDENVGRLLSTLDELSIRDNTLIVFTSDHGHDFHYRWNPQPKRNCYDTASKVPLIFNWKGQFQSGTYSQLMSHVDIAPTILDLCGIEIPKTIQGRSAKELLLGSGSTWRDSVYFQNSPFRRDGRYAEDGKNAAMFERCLVTPEWKLILNSDRPPELYHRQNDPEENNNRYEEAGLESAKKELFDKFEKWAWEIDDSLALSKWLLYKWKNVGLKPGE